MWTYERVLPIVYRVLGSERTGIGSGLSRIGLLHHRAHQRPHARAVRDRAPPAGESERARERSRAVWVTVPTYEEVENIELLVRRVREAVPDAHILVVDDNSLDGTAEKAEALGAELGGIEVLRRPKKMGLGSAYRAGHAVGIARGFDVMIQIDADLSHNPTDLPRLLAAVDRGADLALGSRYTPGGSVPNWPRHRLALSVVGQPLRRVLPRRRRARHDRRLPRVPRVDPRARSTSTRRTRPGTASRSR